MKLSSAKQQVDKRIVSKLSRNIAPSDVVGGVMTFGENNDYPQTIESIVLGSSTGKAVRDIYAKFISGEGFNAPINDVVVGKDYRGREITIRHLLRQCAKSVAMNNGCLIHVNKNLDNQVKNCSPVPFKFFRFNKPDQTGYSSKIVINKNWGDTRLFKKDESKSYDLFTNDKNAFAKQVQKAGGIEKYRGQIHFQFWDDDYLYPLSPFDPVYLDCDTEQQVSLFMNREIRNGFMATTILRVAAGTPEEEQQVVDRVTNATGADGTRVLLMVDEIDPDTQEIKKNGAFAVDTITSNINDKLFETWENSLMSKIRRSQNVPSIFLDYETNKLGGTSGEAIIQATNSYNATTRDARALMSEYFKEIFSNFDNEELKNNTDWTIKPLNLYDNGTTNIQPASGNQANQQK